MSEQDYEQLTLFPADSPASHSPWLESKKEKGTIVTYGLRCSELSESCARIALSVRTYLESSRLPPGKWSRIWSRQGITSSCSILKLRLSELGTGEQGCSSSGAPKMWKTPVVADATARKMFVNSRGEPNLSGQVRLWPTPTARDHKGANSMEHLKQAKEPGNQHHVGQLANAVKLYTTPCAADATGTTGGKNHRSLRTDVGGQLNPTWVEWLQGFHIGWTDLNASETR